MGGTIDVHHHLIPPALENRLNNFSLVWFANIEKARGLQLPTWSAEGTLEAIDECGISTAVISMGHPVHPYVDDIRQVAPICREINDYTAKLRDAHPDRIGFFATLPPMDQTDTCIEEMRYSLNELQADGVVIFSSYAGRYLGHPIFRPVWDEFNQRGAVVLIHPGFEGMAPIEEPRILAPPIIDWTHETTRTAVHLITGPAFVIWSVYLVFFHPLARFPGPKLWAISRIPWAYHVIKGDVWHSMDDFHNRYGSVIRIAPDELSFISPAAWKDIYGARPQLLKDPRSQTPPLNGANSLFTALGDDHRRIRGAFINAFSDKALREQSQTI
ncbi:amidohydrolase family protein [Penicillium canariense]|uniref:6-methylsalicylate decarboxylase n=1 Tax=Penicillium canariense TaxID=189055 RepID=A0A9W9IHT9_9EURO|nr:amidohydrolase family protein [Penicillium canariense]KAJ5176983.1 amidohydrolase family protein [Penicillium canariense]